MGADENSRVITGEGDGDERADEAITRGARGGVGGGEYESLSGSLSEGNGRERKTRRSGAVRWVHENTRGWVRCGSVSLTPTSRARPRFTSTHAQAHTPSSSGGSARGRVCGPSSRGLVQEDVRLAHRDEDERLALVRERRLEVRTHHAVPLRSQGGERAACERGTGFQGARSRRRTRRRDGGRRRTVGPYASSNFLCDARVHKEHTTRKAMP